MDLFSSMLAKLLHFVGKTGPPLLSLYIKHMSIMYYPFTKTLIIIEVALKNMIDYEPNG